jgi:hypothetical protein
MKHVHSGSCGTSASLPSRSRLRLLELLPGALAATCCARGGSSDRQAVIQCVGVDSMLLVQWSSGDGQRLGHKATAALSAVAHVPAP